MQGNQDLFLLMGMRGMRRVPGDKDRCMTRHLGQRARRTPEARKRLPLLRRVLEREDDLVHGGDQHGKFPRIRCRSRDDAVRAPDRASGDTVIRSVSVDRSGKYTLVMEDDAVWSQIDTTALPRQPKPGQKIHIKTATMGSYFATIEGGRAIRLKRDR